MSMYPEIDVDELERLIDDGAVVVDVREAHEYAEAHVAGAHLIALGELADRVHDIPEGPVVVICRSGARSGKACEFLVTQGRDATNVAGGTLAWIESGRVVAVGLDRG